MDLKRDIYWELVQWKEKDNGKVLEVNGARQVGNYELPFSLTTLRVRLACIV